MHLPLTERLLLMPVVAVVLRIVAAQVVLAVLAAVERVELAVGLRAVQEL